MKANGFSAANFLFLVMLFQEAITNGSSALEYQKRMATPGVGPVGTRSSFSNNINTCHFNSWPQNVLNGQVSCSHQQLCYGGYGTAGQERALFAVCYNTAKRIPEFTGHILNSGGVTKAPQKILTNPGDENKKWTSDATLAPNNVATTGDYSGKQAISNYNSVYNRILARGHLSPAGDFAKDNSEFYVTYTTTNCAPQWQPFNGGNWNNLETAIRNFSKTNRSTLYIFTGTGGKALVNGLEFRLKGSVLTPKYYWKAVCDPEAPGITPGTTGQSIVFVAENKPGDISEKKVEGNCPGVTKQQTEKFGVINCYSRTEAATSFPEIAGNLPPFGSLCDPDIRGTFLDTDLQNKLQ
ncbi:uncharacterized protein [Montipora capricornis]|uniref:uncharacterized protein n=1 Tax=Montipora capricornis TaxID=246305 RepID=UPI0035F11751